MKNTKALAITFLSVALVFGIWQAVKHDGSHPPAAPTLKERESSDLAALSSPSTPRHQLASALLHLSMVQKPEALQFIHQHLATAETAKTADPAFDTETVRALGYFISPEAIALLKAQTRSAKPQIRLAAIEAFGIRSQPERSKIIEEMIPQLQREGEKARAWIALAHVGSAELQAKAVHQEIQLLQRKDLDPTTRKYLVSQVFMQGATSPPSKKIPEVEAYFNSLSAQIKTENEFNALAVIRGLKHFCPANRNEIFKTALSRTDLNPNVRLQMLAELVYHSGPEALAIFDSGNLDRKIASGFSSRLRHQIQASKIKPACETSGTAQEKQARTS